MKKSKVLNLVFYVCLFNFKSSSGSVNLVLPTEEVRKLLGLNRELAYIRNGIVASNAADFNIPVSSDLDSVHFLWNNPDPTLPVSYKLVIKIDAGTDPEVGADDATEAMHQPFVNISHSGQIPQSPTVWRVALPCSGKREGQVNVFIDLTLFGPLGAVTTNNDEKSAAGTSTTKLRLKRSKACAMAAADGDVTKAGAPGGSNGTGVRKEDLPPTTPPHMVFMGALLSAIIVIVLLIICVVIIHMRSRNKTPGSSKSEKPQYTCGGPAASATSTTTFMGQQPQQQQQLQQQQQQQPQHHIYEPIPALPHPHFNLGLLTLDTRPDSRVSSELRQRFNVVGTSSNTFELGLMSDAAESRVTDWIQQQQREKIEEELIAETDPQIIFQNLQVDRIRLKLGSLLQEGTFGRVYQGLFECNDGGQADVMIKTVLTGSALHQSEMLILEGVRLQGAVSTHKNVLQLLAATWDGTSPMLIYPYSAQGNLKQYLTKYATGGLSTHQIVRMGIHLLSAMGHIHKRGIMHKDIAARNCFLAEGPTLKLSDSALSRDLFPNDYHCLGDNENRPIKWMPLEAIAQGQFSRASDVWSFGIVLWELMTRGQQPYPEIDPFEMEAYLNEGYRLPQPLNCPDQLFSVLVSCWGTRPQERASLQQLHQSLLSLHKQLQQFV